MTHIVRFLPPPPPKSCIQFSGLRSAVPGHCGHWEEGTSASELSLSPLKVIIHTYIHYVIQIHIYFRHLRFIDLHVTYSGYLYTANILPNTFRSPFCLSDHLFDLLYLNDVLKICLSNCLTPSSPVLLDFLSCLICLMRTCTVFPPQFLPLL